MSKLLRVCGLVFLLGVFVACSEDPQPGEDTGKKPVDSELDLTGEGSPTDGKDDPPVDIPTDNDDTATELADTATDDTDTTPEGEACPPDMLDPFTGLCWFTIVDTDSKWGWPLGANYDEAVSLCDELEQDGWDDWRLPTIDEHRANLITECEYATLGGPCDLRVDCDYYPFLDDCTEFTGSFDERTDCGKCDWFYKPDCKWHIELNTNCATGYWSSTSFQDGTDTNYYILIYDDGNIWKGGTWDRFVACVREAQPLDEDAVRLPVVRPIEGNGCDEDGTTAMCSYLKGADFGHQDTDSSTTFGWYFDGESCVETQYDSAEFCLFPSVVECAKACAAEGECNPKRLDRDALSIYYETNNFAQGGVATLFLAWVCCKYDQTQTLDDMYDDPIDWSWSDAVCSSGYDRGNLIIDPDNPESEIYTTIVQSEWKQICAYTLLPWVEHVGGRKYASQALGS